MPDQANRGENVTDTNDLIMAAPELPCPKCGTEDTSLDYCDGCALIPWGSVVGKYPDSKCAHGDPEHFHRNCRRCHYQWRTDDVIDPRKVCER